MSADRQLPERTSFFGLVKNLAEVAVLLGAVLFVVGWSYLYGYYRSFGLSTDSLNFSVDTVLIHSIPVITRTAFWGTSVAVLIALLIASRLASSSRLVSATPALVLLMALVAVVLASTYANGVGRDNAVRDAYVSSTTLPYVSLQGEDNGPTGCSMEESNYRLLVRANGQVFVTLPIDSVGNLAMPNMRVCSFPEVRVKAMRLQVGLAQR